MLVFKAKLKGQHKQRPRLNRATWTAVLVACCLEHGLDCQNIRSYNLDQVCWVVQLNTIRSELMQKERGLLQFANLTTAKRFNQGTQDIQESTRGNSSCSVELPTQKASGVILSIPLHI
jgi:hypothetical protein